MNRSRRVFSWIIAVAALPVLASVSAQADPIGILHMDINSITIQAMTLGNGNTYVDAPFSTNFTGKLVFTSNSLSTLDSDVDGNPLGAFEKIKSFTGDLFLQNGVLSAINPGGNDPLSAGAVTVTDQANSSYTYEIAAGTGAVFRSPSPFVFNALGYGLAGATYNGEFPNYTPSNEKFDGINVTNWIPDEPLVGDFFQFHYRPNSSGLDMTGDVELYVLPLTGPSGGSPSTPLPTSLLSGLAGIGLLGVYQWRRATKTNPNN